MVAHYEHQPLTDVDYEIIDARRSVEPVIVGCATVHVEFLGDVSVRSATY